MKFKILLAILITSVTFVSSTVSASLILGTGTQALIGGDLTDPENDGLIDENGIEISEDSMTIPGFDKKQFWRDSFLTASICKLISKHTNVDTETAFTCGMMHNIGELLIHIVHEESAVKIDKLFIITRGYDCSVCDR